MNNINLPVMQGYKLILSIVKRGAASMMLAAAKKAGAGGGTVLYGKGTAGKNIYLELLGMEYEPEKEIVLTLVNCEDVENILEVIIKEAKLDKPGKGIGMVIDIKELAGVCHLPYSSHISGGAAVERNNAEQNNAEQNNIVQGDSAAQKCSSEFELIVTIVNRGFAEEVVDASKKAGAEGGTIIHGRGTGIHENAKILGIAIEPEKEIVLTLIAREKTKQVLAAITEAARLDKPCNGIAFVMAVEKAVGICHLHRTR